MLPVLKQLFAWGCWWEVSQGFPRLEAFVVPPIRPGRQHCRHYSSHHASPGCSTTAVAAAGHSDRDDAAQRCRWGVSSSSSSSSSSSASSHSKKRRGRRERGGLSGGEGASSSFGRTGRRHRDDPGLFVAVTTAAVATSTVGKTRHDLEDGDLALASTGQDNRRLPSPRRQRQETLWAAPRRGDASPGGPAAVAGTYVDALVPHLAKMPPVARKVVSEHEKDDATVGNWLRFTDREMAQLQRKAPSVRKDERRQEMLSRRLDDETDEDPGVIAVLRGPRLGMTAEDCRKVVLKHPCLLTMSGDGPSERLAWMITNLAVSQDQLRAIVLKQPRLLSNNIEVNMAPVVHFLTEELGLSIEMVAAIIRKFPEVLNLSVERKLAVKVRWFEETLGMERPDIARMVFTLPALFGYSIEDNMEPKITWLQEAFGTSHQTALQMMVKWPGLFTCNIERNLKPTLDFFLEELSGEVEEVRDIVTSNPRLLGASIEKRLRPRVARMLSRGVIASFSEHRWVLAIRTDAFFDQWVEQLEPPPQQADEARLPLSAATGAAVDGSTGGAAAAAAKTGAVRAADALVPAAIE